jgi:hypothetical protein
MVVEICGIRLQAASWERRSEWVNNRQQESLSYPMARF